MLPVAATDDQVIDDKAKAFLESAGKFTFTNNDGTEQAFFTTQGSQLTSPQDGYHNTDKDFYQKFVQPDANGDPLIGLLEEAGKIGGAKFSAVADDPLGVVDGALKGIVAGIKETYNGPSKVAKEKLENILSDVRGLGKGGAVSLESTAQQQMNDLYGRDVSDAVKATTALQIANVAGTIADVVGAGKPISAVYMGVTSLEQVAKAAVQSDGVPDFVPSSPTRINASRPVSEAPQTSNLNGNSQSSSGASNTRDGDVPKPEQNTPPTQSNGRNRRNWLVDGNGGGGQTGNSPPAAPDHGNTLPVPGNVRVLAGVELDPRLPPPIAGMDYEPNMLRPGTENNFWSHWNGYQAELRSASATRSNAIREAIQVISESKLPDPVKDAAIANLKTKILTLII